MDGLFATPPTARCWCWEGCSSGRLLNHRHIRAVAMPLRVVGVVAGVQRRAPVRIAQRTLNPDRQPDDLDTIRVRHEVAASRRTVILGLRIPTLSHHGDARIVEIWY